MRIVISSADSLLFVLSADAGLSGWSTPSPNTYGITT